MNNLANDPDTERRRTRLKRLRENTERLKREYWDEVKAAFETLEEALSQKWSEGQ